ncbi:MAG: DNA repair protein RadA [Patescibacteria group bacterium]|jgi:DNA repair protein RadA/Sms|nr:DNA repair protein RadA [Patescibacteria group bacterium]
MSKQSSELFICSHCDAQSPKWQGRCPECGKWGTLEKTSLSQVPETNKSATSAPGKVVDFNNITAQDFSRTKTGLEEFDRVLGGGIVNGSLILLGGEPGIGKSTLVLQLLNNLKGNCLYVSGEESAEQIKTRIDRLKINDQHLKFLGETNVETIIATIINEKPSLTIIDSIQTIYSQEAPSASGSINQVRICTTKLLETAKHYGQTIIVIGHVTKFGEVAGPKTLEHLVDVVLYLEGDQYHAFRILRGAKNRFGSTAEVGIFEMQSRGLVEVHDPSVIFLENKNHIPGSVITAAVEGSRIFMLEIQALVNTTNFGYPQRKTNGFDLNRLQLLSATIAQRLGLKLANQDIYLNLVGGLKISEPALDLPVCLAVISALKNKSLPQDTVAFGEVGLGGEIRSVNQTAQRINEARRLGFKQIIIPATKEKITGAEIKINQVKTLAQILDLF